MQSPWVSQARAHWKEHLPAKVKALHAAGQLDRALRQAVILTLKEMDQLTAAGFTADEAWMQVRNTYLFPPGEPDLEEDEPNQFHLLSREANRLHNEILQSEAVIEAK